MSVIKSIFVLTETTFRERDFKRYGISLLSERFRVKVLDCTAWLRPKVWEKSKQSRYDFSGYNKVSSWEEFQSYFSKELFGTILVVDCLLAVGKTNKKTRSWLRQKNIPTLVVFGGNVPPINFYGRRFLRSILGKGIRFFWGRIHRMRTLIGRCFSPQGFLEDLSVLSGVHSLKYPRANLGDKIWGHSFDYDIFLEHNAQNQNIVTNTAVFLDQNLTYNPDILVTNTRPATTDEEYYPVLNRFFDDVERLTGLKIVIAAQPRALYNPDEKIFGNRKIAYAKTAELVRDAKLVFAHYSTSVSFPVLWQKPVVFLTTNALQNSWVRYPIKAFSEALSAPLVNLDQYNEQEICYSTWQKISKSHYLKYKEDLIKRSGTPEKPLWEIIADYIEKNYSAL